MSPDSTETAAKSRVLLLYGGWPGHDPEGIATFIQNDLLEGFALVISQELDSLNRETLREFDVIIPIWTFGEITVSQESALLEAVQEGLGVVAWHGAASAFLHSRSHKLLLGGQFVAHPGGEAVVYEVHFAGPDPLTRGLEDLTVQTEQYYLLMDPAVEVLAWTQIQGGTMEWLAGTRMPVMWKRHWGKGRVFYSSLGHRVEICAHPTVKTILRRAVGWASRRNLTGASS